MRLHVLSDLHLEFAPFDPPAQDFDAVVLAGDIHVGTNGLAWARTKFPDTPIVYVPGNHEYYGHDWDALRAPLRDAAARHGIHLLDRDEVRIRDVRILGCTLWTDFDLYGEARRAEAMQASLALFDYTRIRSHGRLLTPDETRERHFGDRAWLEARLAEGAMGARATVVVTHMLPSFRSTAERYRPLLSSAGFASHLDGLVRSADLWIHGHTHDSFDYREERCRVVCNPRGYRRRSQAFENAGFLPGLVVEA
jgi:predicted phosphodiesterase